MVQPLNTKALPTPKEERWKYTNLTKAMPANLVLAEAPAPMERRVGKGEVVSEPFIVDVSAQDQQHTQPSLNIVLEDNAELTVIERHTGTGAYWKNMVSQITLGANAKLNHIRLQNDEIQAVQTNMAHVSLQRDASYRCFSLNIGGAMSRHEIEAELNGTGAEIELNGLNLLKETQHADTTILVHHKAAHCRSSQFYRSLLADKSHGVFQGKVFVHEGAQKTDGYQLSNAILLSNDAQMSTKPELEIYADDVVCSHGATTGQLEEEPLFYLRSRGLTDKQARELLIQAFVAEVIEKIENEPVQNEVQKDVHQWLQTAL